MAQSEELKFILKMKDEATKVLRETTKSLKEAGLVAVEAEKRVKAKAKATRDEAAAAQAAERAIRKTIAALKEIAAAAGTAEKQIKKKVTATKAEITAAQQATVAIKQTAQATGQQGTASTSAAAKISKMAQATAQQALAAGQTAPALRQVAQALTAQGNAAAAATAKLQQQTQATRQQGQAARGAARDNQDLASTALELGAAYGAIGIASAQVKNIFRPYMQLEDIFVQVAKTTNMAGQELADFQEGFRELAGRLTVPIDQLGEAAAVAGQLGIKSKEGILQFTEVIAMLGTATDLKGEEAAQSIARLLNITGEGPGKIREFAASLVALGNTSAATESQIMRLASEIGRGVAGMGGVDSPQILAIAATLKEMDQQAELAGSSIGRIALTMRDAAALGGQELKILAETTGKSMEEIRDRINESLVGSLEVFADAVKAAQSRDGTPSLFLDEMKLNTVELRKVLNPLIANFDELTEKVALAKKAFLDGQALIVEYGASSQRLSAQLTLLGNNATLFGEAFAASIAGPAKLAVQGLTIALQYLTDGFTALPGVLQSTIAVIAVLGPAVTAAAISARALGVALNFIGINATSTRAAIAALMTRMSALFALVRAHPLGMLATAAALVGTAVLALTSNVDGLGAALSRNETMLTRFGQTAADVSRQIATMSKEAVGAYRNGLLVSIAETDRQIEQSKADLLKGQTGDEGWFDQGNSVFRPPMRMAATAQDAVNTEIRAVLRDAEQGKIAVDQMVLALSELRKRSTEAPENEQLDKLIGRYSQINELTQQRLQLQERLGLITTAQTKAAQKAAEGNGRFPATRPSLGVLSDETLTAFNQMKSDADDANMDSVDAQIAAVRRKAEDLKAAIRNDLYGASAEVINAKLAEVDANAQRQIDGISAKASVKIAKTVEKMTAEIAAFVAKGSDAGLSELQQKINEVNRDAEQLIARAPEAGASAKEIADIRVSAEQQIAAIRAEQKTKRDEASSDAQFDIDQLQAEVEALGKGTKAYDAYKLAKDRAEEMKGFKEALSDPELGFRPEEIKAYVDEYERLLKKREEMIPIIEKQKEQEEEMKERINDVRDAFSDAATDIIFSAKSISEALSELAAELAQMVFTRSTMDPLASSLSSGLQSGLTGGGVGSFIGSLFGITAAHGHAFDRGHVQKFAKGGVVDRPTGFAHAGGLGLMGEAGTEAILPLQRMSDGDLGVRMAGGGSSVVIHAPVNITIEGGSTGKADDDAELAKKVGASVHNQLKALVTSQLREQMRPGNMLNPVGSI